MAGASTSSLVAAAAVGVELTKAEAEQRTAQAATKRARTDKLVAKQTVLLVRLAAVQCIFSAVEQTASLESAVTIYGSPVVLPSLARAFFNRNHLV